MFRVVKTACASWFRVCRRLDMESVRTTYLEEIGQYANIDLSRNLLKEPLTAFIDVLEADVAELQDIECFISPAAVFGYLERIGSARRWGPGSGPTNRWWNC